MQILAAFDFCQVGEVRLGDKSHQLSNKLYQHQQKTFFFSLTSLEVGIQNKNNENYSKLAYRRLAKGTSHFLNRKLRECIYNRAFLNYSITLSILLTSILTFSMTFKRLCGSTLCYAILLVSTANDAKRQFRLYSIHVG